MNITDFLRARLDSDAARAEDLQDRERFQDDIYVDVWTRDPARELREVEAKRELLKLHARHEWLDGCDVCDFANESCGCVSGPSTNYPCDTVKLLALPYADHPDFDPDWRP
jgi:hypothetical protein